jgi:DNA-binding MarR family transcriptional regulator
MPSRRRGAVTLTKAHYVSLAALRYALGGFLRFSQSAARKAGVPPQQHQALLAIKGAAGRDALTIGELAQRLHVQPHGAVNLVDRLAKRGLVARKPSREDRRRVHVALTAKGEALVERLSAAHWEELRQIRPELQRLLDSMDDR